MAIKPTIYKFKIELSNINQNHYETIPLTVALHPSETVERMMARTLAFTLHAEQQPVLGKGLSNAEEADLWAHDLDGQLALWVEVGEPAVERIKKASRLARRTIVYSFNSKSDVWWRQNQADIEKLRVTPRANRWFCSKTKAMYCRSQNL